MRRVALACALAATTACTGVRPPAHPIPTGRDALARLADSNRCVRGVHADAKVEHWSERGRVRGSLLLYAVRPASLRADVLAPPPFQSIVATLATDGASFAIADLREKRYFEGRASSCAIGRFAGVDVPPHALASLLAGQPPVLVHASDAPEIRWDGGGYYVVRIPGTRDAVEELRLAPRAGDHDRAWTEQRLHLVGASVAQRGVIVWRASLDDFAPASAPSPVVDPDGLDAPIPPSGPPCDAELPRAIDVEVPSREQRVRLRYNALTVNPPLPAGVFAAPPSDGLAREIIDCAE